MEDTAPANLKTGKTLDILLYGEIGFGPLSSASIAKLLDENKDAETIRVRVNSGGGDAFEGVAIHNLLAGSKAQVEVDIDGQACSAASLVAMAADKIRISDNAMVMIHEAHGGAGGTAAQHVTDAKVLEALNANAAKIYAGKCGKSVEEVAAMMATDNWMTAKEAVAAGFADEITDPKAIAACVTRFARMGVAPMPEDKPVVQAAPEAPPAPPAPVSGDSVIEALAKATGLDPAAVVAMLTDKLDAIAQLLATEAEKDGSAAEQVLSAVVDAPAAPAAPTAPATLESRLQARMVASLRAEVETLKADKAARDAAVAKAREDAENAALDAEVQTRIDGGFVMEAERVEFRAFLKSDPEAARRLFSAKRVPDVQVKPEVRTSVTAATMKISSMPEGAVRRQAFSLKAAGYRNGDETACIARAMELVKEN